MKREIIHHPVLVLVGPTAVGKTALSLCLAHRYNCEIVSVDSMQVFRYMDIGTAKVLPSERKDVAHHLIDIVDPDEKYDAAMFSKDALMSIRDIHGRGKIPLLTGGTGLYLRALIQGMFSEPPVDAQIRLELQRRLSNEGLSILYEELRLIDCISAERIQKNDSQRILRALEIFYTSGIPWSTHLEEQRCQSPQIEFDNLLQIGLTCDRERLYSRINQRCQQMIEDGLEKEVRNLMAMGYDSTLKSLGSIGYRHMINYLQGTWSFEDMLRLLARDTRRYAKRQYTWFSKMHNLEWFPVNDQEKISNLIDHWLMKINYRQSLP